MNTPTSNTTAAGTFRSRIPTALDNSQLESRLAAKSVLNHRDEGRHRVERGAGDPPSFSVLVLEFATGIAVNSCARQLGAIGAIGAIVGIAGLVTVLRSTGLPLDGAHGAWTLIALSGLACAIAGIALGRSASRRFGAGPAARVPERPSGSVTWSG